MANYSAIKAAVNAYIKANGRKEITGNILNAVLNATIDSLGRYFQFAGGALPTDDPGTPDQNVCYLAGEPGLYTNFGNIRIENEEVALLFWDGVWTKQKILIGIREVIASVDNQVGTPSVDVSYSGGELVLTFHNLKGEQGETGDPAGFGTIGADINGGVGIPGVSVETSGDNTAKNLMFHFTNLKGETGVTSVVATIDNTSGNPSCQVSLVNGVLTLAFSGLKGLKGDTGVSADYPITIYNGLDSDATDQALAAAQGKFLQGEIDQLKHNVDELDDAANNEESDVVIEEQTITETIPGVSQIENARITNYGGQSDQITTRNGSAVTVFQVEAGKTYNFHAWGGTTAYVPACLSPDLLSALGVLTIIETYGVDGTTGYKNLSVTPSASGYLYVCDDSGVTPSVTSTSVSHLFKDKAVEQVAEDVADLQDVVNSLSEDVQTLNNAAENEDSDIELQTIERETAIELTTLINNARVISSAGSEQIYEYENGHVGVFSVNAGKTYRFRAWGGGDSFRRGCLSSLLRNDYGSLPIIEKYGGDTFDAAYETITISPSVDGYLYVITQNDVTPSVSEINQEKVYKIKSIPEIEELEERVQPYLDAIDSSLGDVEKKERTGDVQLLPSATIDNARITSYGGLSDQIYSAPAGNVVKVYAVRAGVTYSVPSNGLGQDSNRNAMLASNYVDTYGHLDRIQIYGSGDNETLTITPSVDCYLYVHYAPFYDYKLPRHQETEECLVLKDGAASKEILSGKKWAAFGDSFTFGATQSVLPDGIYAGKRKTYPFFIGNRTGIEILESFFASGRTLANPADGTFTNSATNPNSPGYYQNLPEDVDYITIYLGINDSHHAPGSGGGDGEDNTGEIPIGAISDNTTATYYGAWNVLLSWLIENRPFAHIGIIISNGCDSADYRTAQIAIARKYGIPFIDLNGDDRTPFMIRSQNNNIPSAIRSMRTRKQAVDYDGTQTGSVNLHPNDDAHLFESFFIENFLRTI